MIKRTFALTLLLLTVILSQAQETKFRFGLKAIPSVSWLTTETKGMERNGTAFNFGYGLHAEYMFTDNYSFASGIYFINSGGGLDFPQGSDSVYYLVDNDKFFLTTREYQLSYVTLPVTLKLRTNQMGYLTYFGQFGMDLGFKAKAKANDKGFFEGISAISTQEAVDISTDVALMRVGLNIGIGAEYNLSGNTAVLMGLNFHNGFTNILKHDSEMLHNENGSSFLQKAMGNQISLSIGIIF